MLTSRHLKFRTQLPLLSGLVALVFALAACQPIQDPRLQEAADAAASPLQGTPASEEEAAEAIPGVGPAMATISADSLRVRSAPNDETEVVAGVRAGESYRVIGISSDGAWLQIEVERAAEGQGWVAASFVVLEGDITNIPIVEVETTEVTAAETTPEPAEEATPEPTEEPAEEATPAPTEEPAEEATPAPTEEPAEEATPVPTEEPVEEATPEPTEEPAEEATPVPAEEAAEEATPEPTEEPAEEATPEPTEEPAEEAVAAPAAGFVRVNTDGMALRVRSAPTTEEENKVGNVFDGETYRVLEISEDGEWVRIDVPQLELENGGWVSAEFVIVGE